MGERTLQEESGGEQKEGLTVLKPRVKQLKEVNRNALC